jgi:hypothetical protein
MEIYQRNRRFRLLEKSSYGSVSLKVEVYSRQVNGNCILYRSHNIMNQLYSSNKLANIGNVPCGKQSSAERDFERNFALKEILPNRPRNQSESRFRTLVVVPALKRRLRSLACERK